MKTRIFTAIENLAVKRFSKKYAYELSILESQKKLDETKLVPGVVQIHA